MLASVKLHTNFENSFNNNNDHVKYRKQPMTRNFGAFSHQPMEGQCQRTSTNDNEGNSEEDFSNIFKISKQFYRIS